MQVEDVLRLESERNVSLLIRALKDRVTRTQGGVATGDAAKALASSLGISAPRGATVNVFDVSQMTVVDETVATRREAALALGRIKDPAAYQALSEALSDPAQEVRSAAASALASLSAKT
jgi:HEAT repeat protein